jgi:hypothetical protein
LQISDCRNSSHHTSSRVPASRSIASNALQHIVGWMDQWLQGKKMAEDTTQ